MHANRPETAPAPAAAFVEPDIVRRFLVWAQRAGAQARAEAASALARAYLHSDLTPALRAETCAAMTALLDDPSPLVRRALAEALSGAREAPRHIVLALAGDQSDVAAAVLQRSPALTDAELADSAATGDVVVQSALARRADLSPAVTAALIESAEREAILTLVGNAAVGLPVDALTRVFARFEGDAEARERLTERAALPASLKARFAVATARDLSAAAARWLPRERAARIAREARDQMICSIACSCRPDERTELVRALRECGALTPALLIRSLLGGERDLFAAALAELSGVPVQRVQALILNPHGQGFAALARRAGVKRPVAITFAAALGALNAYGREDCEGLKLTLVRRAIDACEGRADPALAEALALLWRFAAEAAKAEASGFARAAIEEARAPRLPQALNFAPVNDDADVRPGGPAADLIAPRIELPIDLIARLSDAA